MTDIRWNIVNKPTRKWIRKKDLGTVSKPSEVVSNSYTFTSSLNSVNIKGMPPVDYNSLEPPKH